MRKLLSLFVVSLLLVSAGLLNSTQGLSNQSAASESDIFLPVTPGVAGSAYFYFTNKTRRVSTLFAKIVEKKFPKGKDDPDWFTQFCYSNVCFLDEGESPLRIQPDRSEEMHITMFPYDSAKLGDTAKVSIEIWPTSDTKLKATVTAWSVVVEKKLVKMQINSKQASVAGSKETKNVPLDVPPFITSGRTMVPLRFIGEALNAKIDWEPSSRRVSYELGDMKLYFWVDKKEAKINIGPKYTKTIPLDVAPVIVQGRTFVPVRYVSEFLGAKVGWEASSQTVSVDFPSENNKK
jgi:hypothetical protein